MKFSDAARVQYRLSSYYTVQLVKPDGTKVELGSTMQKTGIGLLKFVSSRLDKVRELIPNPDTVEMVKKTATALHFSNGYRIEFGGTIRQEATEG